MSTSTKGYYIGCELASGRLNRADGSDFLAAATNPIDQFVLGILQILLEKGIVSKEEGKKLVIEIARLTGEASNDICILGIKNFSKIRYR